ncbi:MAG: cytochrome c3 family protein [Dehalococcoidia bacterium]|nr:cytochrome c3 family protein [Dehalococcoidia bacterium]
MRRTTILVGVVAAVAMAVLAVLGSGGGTASADGGPHVVETGATPDKCAACHRIHTGQNEYLLKDAGTVEDFCFSCHGTGGPGSDLAVQEGTFYGGTTPGAPYGGKTASTTLGLRAGGFDYARINTTDPAGPAAPSPTPAAIGVLAVPQTVNSRHTLETLTTLWGNGPVGTVGAGPSYTLECTSCHDPHGNGNYRILRTIPTGSGGAGYTIPDTYPKAASDYTTSNYLNMYFGGVAPANPMTEPPGAVPGVSILKDTSEWCAQCHTRYLAESGTNNPLNPNPKPNSEGSRVDSGDAIYTFRHTSKGYGFSSYGGSPGFKYNNRACITCHATHGSNASMPGGATGTTYSSTVPWPDDGGVSVINPTDPQRASMLKMDNRGMCRKCHSSVQ